MGRKVSRPICEECAGEMVPYTDDATEKDCWACDTCGWSEDSQ